MQPGMKNTIPRQEELMSEIQEILFKIKQPDTRHDEYVRLTHRMDEAWKEFLEETERNRRELMSKHFDNGNTPEQD